MATRQPRSPRFRRGDTVHGHDHKVFKDALGNVLAESCILAGMSHRTPIFPGTGEEP